MKISLFQKTHELSAQITNQITIISHAKMRYIAKKVDFKWIKNRPMHSVSTKKQASERRLNCRKCKTITCS